MGHGGGAIKKISQHVNRDLLETREFLDRILLAHFTGQ